MSKKLTFELKRKSIHLLGLSYLLYYHIIFKIFNSGRIAMMSLVSVFILFIAVEFFRLIEKRKIPVFHIFFRSSEENTLGGQVYMILGIILALSLFEFQIAVAVILMTLLGDMAAAIFGIAFGKHWIKKLPDTAWEGVIAELIVNLVIGFLIIKNPLIFIPMAVMATIVETVFPHVDDNLTIPLFAGFTGQVLKMLVY